MTTYKLPYNYCFIISAVSSTATRGIAIAMTWNDGSNNVMYSNRLHDDSGSRAWSSWCQRGGAMGWDGSTFNLYI